MLLLRRPGAEKRTTATVVGSLCKFEILALDEMMALLGRCRKPLRNGGLKVLAT